MTNVWSDSRGARNNPENLDVKTACNNLEKSMFALGKAHNTILFARRNSSLGSFFRDRKKAGDIVKCNQQVFSAEEDVLFGWAFLEALHCKAKGSKRLREAQWELTKSRNKFKSKYRNKFLSNSSSASQGKAKSTGPPASSATQKPISRAALLNQRMGKRPWIKVPKQVCPFKFFLLGLLSTVLAQVLAKQTTPI